MGRNRYTFLAGAGVPIVAVLAFAGCGSGNSSAVTIPKTASGKAATIGISDGDLGEVLVNSQGRTLYLFRRDSGTMSACTGACAELWPPLRATGSPTVGSGANASIVATSPRSDGNAQVTYNGHPLYLYSGDTKPGETKGEGLTAFGGAWYALSSAGNQVTGNGSNSGGGYGY
jgi:predicted lipoprotein with Yx(FWY)xxD motif